MFRLKYVISTTLVIILLTITSVIKNQTRILEKKLSKLNKEINLKEQDINESQLDFYFLTSPAELEKKIKTIGLNNYSPIENSKIFNARGYSKKDAEQKAAALILKKIGL